MDLYDSFKHIASASHTFLSQSGIRVRGSAPILPLKGEMSGELYPPLLRKWGFSYNSLPTVGTTIEVVHITRWYT
jgi:hypothetical protein